jgi:hypothetical protein
MAADPSLVQLGTGGVLALLIIREVLGFMNQQKSRHNTDTVTKEFCDERNAHVQQSLNRLEKKMDELPARINGGLK